MRLDGLLFDLRIALRGLRRDRTFTFAAIATLALAIGLNATVFTITDAMLFRGFPLVMRNDRLVYLQERSSSGMGGLSYADFEDWRTQAQAFDDMAFVGGASITFRDGDGRPIDMRATTVSTNIFGLLGVPPLLGRDFVPSDEHPGAPPVAILNYRFWESRFGGRADVVGSTVHIDGAPATIVGVMPERFDFPMEYGGDLWLALARTPELLQRGLTPGAFTVVGRLRDGVTPQQARVELEGINRRLGAEHLATNRGLVPTMVTYAEFVSGSDAAVIWGSVWAAAWFVWLIACGNVANLTLVRTIGRWRELSTRLALGAGQGRTIRQMAIESLTLTSLAGALGWWITIWSVQTWATLAASRFQVVDYSVDLSTLAYVGAISLAAAIVVSIAPIARVAQLGITGALKGDARGVTQDLRGKRLATGLVAFQTALAIVLLSGAGVLVRSFANIVGAETGIRHPEHVLVGTLTLPSAVYSDAGARLGYFDRLDARLRAIPAIEGISISGTLPVRGVGLRPLEIEGRVSPPDGPESTQFISVGSEYFRVMGVSPLAGREFDERDRASSLSVAIVNQSFAATFWPGEEPLGKRLRAGNRNAAAEWRVVVGVVPNIMQGDALRQSFKPVVYVPFRQESPAFGGYFFARTSVPPEQVAQAVRIAVQGVDPDVPLTNFKTVDAGLAFERDYMDPQHSELGKCAAVAPIVAAIALLLSALGLSAVVARSVTQRTKEIGVRMAIGAAARDISRMVLREGMLPVATGMTAGLAASFAANRVLQSQLVGVSPYDPMTMATAPIVLIAIALIACRIPARRAMQVDPVVALRHE